MKSYEYSNKRIGAKNLWVCTYKCNNAPIAKTWDSYDTTICGLDYRIKINGLIVVYVGCNSTCSPTTRQHTGYIARELGFSYYDFKAALNSPTEFVASNDEYYLIYDPEQTLFNDTLNCSSACDLRRFHAHETAHNLV